MAGVGEWMHMWTTPGGTRAYVRPDGEGGLILKEVAPLDPFLERNKAMANHNDGWSPSRELRREGSIPLHLAEKWKREEGVDVFAPSGREFLTRRLNDIDYQHLRTSPGKT